MLQIDDTASYLFLCKLCFQFQIFKGILREMAMQGL